MDEKNGLNIIMRDLPSMSATEKKIGTYILENPQKVVNMTLRVLAGETGVSEGSVVNFAARLGFEGYTRLKINIAQSLSSQTALIFDNVVSEDKPKDAMRKMKDNIISSLDSTFELIDNKDLERAAELICGVKKRIELYATGSSAPIASDAAFRLMKLGFAANAVCDLHISPVSAIMLDEDCLAIAISYTGRTHNIIKTMKLARERGAKTMCITCYPDSPLANICDVSLIAVSGETEINKLSTVSRLSQLFIIDSLCAYIGYNRRDIMLENQNSINEIWDEYYEKG
ncbi:MAG: MurR/RpiR family transcriptional regulator [Clostridia bacterium]|nr:MurR/RpiR family transcriptional regulator [Clostridia bacterium]